MSVLLESPALLSSYRYFLALLVRFRRFINRSVAEILASREREAMLFMLTRLGTRKKSGGPGRARPGLRATLLGLIVVGSLSPAVAKAEDHDVRDPGRKHLARDLRPETSIIRDLDKLCIELTCI